MRVRFRIFESTFSSWKALFQEAADFAETIRSDHLISISHSEDKDTGVVAVWYWEEVPDVSALPSESDR
jgi:hypothetical protein